MGQMTWMLLMGLIGLCCILLIIDMKNITSDGGKCLQSPITFGIKQFEELNHASMVCTCNYDVANSPTLYINSENITINTRGYPIR